MRLLHAELEGFRNFERAVVDPGAGLTALVGANGQGKTNALEALYLLSALRPLRPVPRRALIRSGGTKAVIRAEVVHQSTGLTHQLELRLEGSARALQKDGKPCSPDAFLGSLVSVAFTPDDLQLAKAGPDGRRRFLDRALLNAQPGYLTRALRYGKAMRDRNRLLAQGGSDAALDAFDAVIAREGAHITQARRAYVNTIAPRVVERFRAIADPAPKLSVRYASSLGEPSEDIQDAFLRALGARREKDRQRAITGVGPHLDDMAMALDGVVARDRASQGQHRALILALKLVEIEALTAALREPPLLLLDDMSSELDETRTEQLFRLVRSLDAQVILTSTTTDPRALAASLGSPSSLRVHTVQNGSLGPAETLALVERDD